MPNPIQLNAIRHPEDIGLGVWRWRVAFGEAGIATTGIPVVTLERGAIPLRASVRIETAFNAGTTNVLTLGDSTTADSLVTSANAVAGTAGYKVGTGVSLGTELAADTTFYAKFTQSGTAATAGVAEFIVEFANARNWAHLNRNQNNR